MQGLMRGVPPGIGRAGWRWGWLLAPAAASILALSMGAGPVLPSVVGTGQQPRVSPQASTRLVPPVAAADPLPPAVQSSVTPPAAGGSPSGSSVTATTGGSGGGTAPATTVQTTGGSVSSPARITQPASSQTPAPQPVIPYTTADLTLMARVVHGEATGQPVTAKLGVAAVIVNRVRDPGWPKTIPDVIYAPGQFQSVGYPLFANAPSQADVQAARLALAGDDPTGGAVYFYAAAQTPSGSPMFDLHTLVVLGAFTFAS